MAMEEQERESIDEYVEVRPSGYSGTGINFLRETPYDLQEWIDEVRKFAMEEVPDDVEDDEVIAHAHVDLVSYYDPDTGEFDVSYEGRWELPEKFE